MPLKDRTVTSDVVLNEKLLELLHCQMKYKAKTKIINIKMLPLWTHISTEFPYNVKDSLKPLTVKTSQFGVPPRNVVWHCYP